MEVLLGTASTDDFVTMNGTVGQILMGAVTVTDGVGAATATATGTSTNGPLSVTNLTIGGAGGINLNGTTVNLGDTGMVMTMGTGVDIDMGIGGVSFGSSTASIGSVAITGLNLGGTEIIIAAH